MGTAHLEPPKEAYVEEGGREREGRLRGLEWDAKMQSSGVKLAVGEG